VSIFYRRRLPHLHVDQQPIFITWRLHGSLPPHRVFPAETTAGQAFVTMDSLLDHAGSGPLYLHQPEVASLVVKALHHGEQQMGLYQLHAYVVMPNHVHLLITPSVEVAKITHSLKRFTGREANRFLGLIGQPFWQDESYDHLVRGPEELKRIMRYIESNPVRAGLVTKPHLFHWSSAGRRSEESD
jgi:REP element-mobilizing transposase RayT